ncbi:MAG: aminopeptidase [Spirochaetaceae bacterium]|jgi:predicted aminopeptidase|nr:aminopeptidase [Spirochaetaceae bacterium]
MKNFNGAFLYLFPALAAVLFLLGFSLLCSGCYTLKQGGIMLGYLGRAVPLESLAAGPDTAEEDTQFVELVTDIRRFAVEELGLNETKNYTRYVNIDRDYLAAVVSASAKDSFKRHEWRFPVVGNVPYKGFFIAKDARSEAAKLSRKDLDVWIRAVDAFSTLGWFSDPLYSFMRGYPPDRMADILIHELVHATIFIKDNMQFNEELAEFIGSEGARLYIAERYGGDSPQMERMTYSEADNAAYVSFIRELSDELDAVYRSEIPREQKLERKASVIAAAKARFEAEYESRFHSEAYRAFLEIDVNNAYLELYRLYYSGGSRLKGLYAESGAGQTGDLRAFIAAAKTITRKGGDPILQLRSAFRAR